MGHCVSSSDFVSQRSRCEDITYCLHNLVCNINRLANNRIHCSHHKIIVCEMLWVIIHAAILVFCEWKIDSYLQLMLEGKHNIQGYRASLCSSHIIARLAKTMPGFSNPKLKRTFLKSFAGILHASSIEDARELWRLLTLTYNSEYLTFEVTQAKRKLNPADGEILLEEMDGPEPPHFNNDFLNGEGLRKNLPLITSSGVLFRPTRTSSRDRRTL